MNLEQAKRILQVCRPGDRDAATPEFAEALELARHDAELGRWFAEQQQFDAAMSRSLREEPVPAHLKAAILSRGPQEASLAWWREPVRLAWAAALVGLLGLGGLFFWPSGPQFPEFCQELFDGSWNADQHLQLVSSDLGQIRTWLAQHHVRSDFVFPPGLQGMTIRGCRVVECQGKRAAQLCVLSGSSHTHLFVLDRVDRPGWPDEAHPQSESCGGWQIVSWSQGDKLYLLSGMKIWAFLKKFRQGGHWVWTG